MADAVVILAGVLLCAFAAGGLTLIGRCVLRRFGGGLAAAALAGGMLLAAPGGDALAQVPVVGSGYDFSQHDDAESDCEAAGGEFTVTSGTDGTCAIDDDSGQVVPESITGADIDDGSITSNDIFVNTITSDEIGTGAVRSDEIQDDTIAHQDIGTGAVRSDEIQDGAVGSDDLAEGAVDADAIGADAIIGRAGTDGIDADGADADDPGNAIMENSIGQDDIAQDAVGESELADNAVDTAAIQDDAVTNAKLAADSIQGSEGSGDDVIEDDSIGQADIAEGGVGTSEIEDESIGQADIGQGGVGTSEIEDDSIVHQDIAESAVRSEEILDETIVHEDIKTGAVRSDEILDETIVHEDIAESAVRSEEILDETIVHEDIDDGAVRGSGVGGTGTAAADTAEIGENSLDSRELESRYDEDGNPVADSDGAVANENVQENAIRGSRGRDAAPEDAADALANQPVNAARYDVIQDYSIGGEDIDSNQIGSRHLIDGAVTRDKLSPALQNQLSRHDDDIEKLYEGVAMAMALGGAAIIPDKTASISLAAGYFENKSAAALNLSIKMGDSAIFNLGAAYGLNSERVGGRAAVSFGF